MKKLFTLVFGVLFALCANAAVLDIGEPTNNVANGDEIWYDASTKTITFHEQWSYRPGWWLSGNMDASDYDEFVLEIDNPDKVKIQIAMEYDADNAHNEAQGATDKIVLKLLPDYKKSIKQIYLQCTQNIEAGKPKTVTFKKAYFKSADPSTSSVLYEGELILNSWGASATVDKAYFADAVAGDKLRYTATTGECSSEWNADWGSQIQVKTTRSGWAAIADAIGFKEAGTFDVEISDTEITINDKDAGEDVKTTMLAELKNYGLAIQGMGAVVTKVELVKTTTNISNPIAAPSATSVKAYNLAGQQVNASYKGVVIKGGKKFVQK